MPRQRYARLRAVLERRQPDLTVLMDNVHKPHNLSAVLRTCDAAGVYEAHAVWPSERLRPANHTASGSGKWVPVRTHPDLETAVSALSASGHTVVAAHLGPDAIDYRAIDYTRPTAVLLGAELDGLSGAARQLAHRHVIIPMHGHVESLNVSVAAAVILFEAERQRAAAGLYDAPRLDGEALERALFEWAHPRIARWCAERGLDYPTVDEDGDVVGPLPR